MCSLIFQDIFGKVKFSRSLEVKSSYSFIIFEKSKKNQIFT